MITLFLIALASTAFILCSALFVLFALMVESCHPPKREALPSSARNPLSHAAAVIV